jgi:hypothetical protein
MYDNREMKCLICKKEGRDPVWGWATGVLVYSDLPPADASNWKPEPSKMEANTLHYMTTYAIHRGCLYERLTELGMNLVDTAKVL